MTTAVYVEATYVETGTMWVVTPTDPAFYGISGTGPDVDTAVAALVKALPTTDNYQVTLRSHVS